MIIQDKKKKKAAYTVGIQQQVCCLEIPMNNVVLVQIVHSFADINGELQQVWELQRYVLLM